MTLSPSSSWSEMPSGAGLPEMPAAARTYFNSHTDSIAGSEEELPREFHTAAVNPANGGVQPSYTDHEKRSEAAAKIQSFIRNHQKRDVTNYGTIRPISERTLYAVQDLKIEVKALRKETKTLKILFGAFAYLTGFLFLAFKITFALAALYYLAPGAAVFALIALAALIVIKRSAIKNGMKFAATKTRDFAKNLWLGTKIKATNAASAVLSKLKRNKTPSEAIRLIEEANSEAHEFAKNNTNVNLGRNEYVTHYSANYSRYIRDFEYIKYPKDEEINLEAMQYVNENATIDPNEYPAESREERERLHKVYITGLPPLLSTASRDALLRENSAISVPLFAKLSRKIELKQQELLAKRSTIEAIRTMKADNSPKGEEKVRKFRAATFTSFTSLLRNAAYNSSLAPAAEEGEEEGEEC